MTALHFFDLGKRLEQRIACELSELGEFIGILAYTLITACRAREHEGRLKDVKIGQAFSSADIDRSNEESEAPETTL